MSDDHDEHHAHIETPAPFLFCVAWAIMFIGLVMATSGGEDKSGDTGYWFVFILGIIGMFTAFFIWVQDYWNQESEEDEHIETYHDYWASISTRKFGIWIFLLTEVMVFSTLLSAYLRYRSAIPDYGTSGIDCGLQFEDCWVPAADVIRSHLIFGVINTFALLLSSLTVVLGLYAARNNNPKAATRYLMVTFVLGALFLVLKLWEWGEMKDGHFWGEECSAATQDISNHCIAPKYEHGFWLDTSIEGSTFYITTGTHGAHVLVGLIALGYLIAKANKDGYNEEYNETIELFGLYWHYVDVVWVFVFPFFYLY